MKPNPIIKTLVVTPIQQNCRVLSVEGSPRCIVVDPGGDAERIQSYLEKQNLTIAEIWLTHSHLDHCGGVKLLKQKYGCNLLGHEDEKIFRGRVEESSAMFGIEPGIMLNCPEPDKFLSGGEILHFEGLDFEVLFTPGHSPGHLCFYQKDCGILFAGDTLFSGSIGRTDLPAGNHQQLINSIKRKILVLPDETKVMSGHGPDTTVGNEKKFNPFLIN